MTSCCCTRPRRATRQPARRLRKPTCSRRGGSPRCPRRAGGAEAGGCWRGPPGTTGNGRPASLFFLSPCLPPLPHHGRTDMGWRASRHPGDAAEVAAQDQFPVAGGYVELADGVENLNRPVLAIVRAHREIGAVHHALGAEELHPAPERRQ